MDDNSLMRSLSDSGPLSDDLVRTGSASNMRCLGVGAMRLALGVMRDSGTVLLQVIGLLVFEVDFLAQAVFLIALFIFLLRLDRLVLFGIFFFSLD